MSNKLLSAAVIAGALTMASSAMAGSGHDKMDHKHKKMEKCYGVAKAGHNDCGSSDGKHTCQGHSTETNEHEWLYLPAGICDKLENGMVKDLSDAETDPKSELKKMDHKYKKMDK